MVDFLDMFEVVWRGEGGFKDVVVVDFRFEVVEDFFVFDNVVVFGGQEVEVSDFIVMIMLLSQLEVDDSEEVVEISGEDDLEQS